MNWSDLESKDSFDVVVSLPADLIRDLQAYASNHGVSVDALIEQAIRALPLRGVKFEGSDGTVFHLTPEELTEIRDLFRVQQKKIEAIKRLREITGAGLRESKHFVESL